MLTLGGGSKTWAQQDSSKLELFELKQISGLLIELAECRELSATAFEKEALYKDLIKDYNENEQLYEQQIKNLEQLNESIKPAWYDTFWVGASVAGIVVATIAFLTR